MLAALVRSFRLLGYEVEHSVLVGRSLVDYRLAKQGAVVLVLQRDTVEEREITYITGVGNPLNERWIVTEKMPNGELLTYCQRASVRVVTVSDILAEASCKRPVIAQAGQMPPQQKDPRNVFVVHGRDITMKDQLTKLLRAYGLNPVDFPMASRDTGKSLPFIGEVLDYAFTISSAVVVLLTPDDEGRVKEGFRYTDDPLEEHGLQDQPRLNVIFEAGIAMGRHPGRTILVRVGRMRLFSDIAGRHLVYLHNTRAAREELGRRLEAAGCPVDWSSKAWIRAGRLPKQ